MSTLMLGEGLEACKMANEMGCPVFVGGPHPTTKPDEMMEYSFIDACVIGEGEIATVEVLQMLHRNQRHPIEGAYIRGLDGTIYPSKNRRPVEQLDSLPFPAWDLLDMQTYIDSWGQLDSFQPRPTFTPG